MQDRIPTYPGRVKLTPVAGEENTYDMTREDEPTQVGTPLNKATLLTDSTETAIWGDAQNRTVNEALNQINEALNSAVTTINDTFNTEINTINSTLSKKSLDFLMDVTVSANVAEVELDLSTINMNEYGFLKLFLFGGVSTSPTYSGLILKINDISQSVYYSGGQSGDTATNRTSIILTDNSYYGGCVNLEITPADVNGGGVAFFAEYVGGGNSPIVGFYNSVMKRASQNGANFIDIASIQISSERPSSNYIKSGTRILVWGGKA